MNPELQAYLDEHSIESIFKEILAVIVEKNQLIQSNLHYNHCNNLQNQPKSIDFKQFFQHSDRSLLDESRSI